MFKFIIQQNALTSLILDKNLIEIYDKYKIGFRVFDKEEYAQGFFNFIICDILVALSVIFHQHCLAFIGLWKIREWDIETLEKAKKRIRQHRKRSRFMKRSLSFDLKNAKAEEEKSLISDFESQRMYLGRRDSSSENISKQENTIKYSPRVPISISNFERNLANKQSPTNNIFIVNIDESKDSKNQNRKIRQSIDLDQIESNKLITEPIQSSVGLKRKLSGDLQKLENLELLSSSSYNENLKYDENYFIHEYSSDLDKRSIKSWMSRIWLSWDERYSELEFMFFK